MVKIGNILATILIITAWALNYFINNLFTTSLFVISWFLVLYLIIKFIKEAKQWKKQ